MKAMAGIITAALLLSGCASSMYKQDQTILSYRLQPHTAPSGAKSFEFLIAGNNQTLTPEQLSAAHMKTLGNEMARQDVCSHGYIIDSTSSAPSSSPTIYATTYAGTCKQ